MIYDLRRPVYEVGDIVITTKGFKFELISREGTDPSWKDLTTGISWLAEEPGKYNHYQALEKFGDRLPTMQEFETAASHGFGEIVIFKGDLYWSSTVHPNYNYAYQFSRSRGDADIAFRDDDCSIRCVNGR